MNKHSHSWSDLDSKARSALPQRKGTPFLGYLPIHMTSLKTHPPGKLHNMPKNPLTPCTGPRQAI